MKENERDRAVLADSSRYLSACSSLRAISVARLQNQRYSEAYDMLQKTVRSYRKVKKRFLKIEKVELFVGFFPDIQSF